MAASPLRKAIFDAVESRLSSSGFELKRTKDSFQRSRDGITDLFQLVCLNDVPGYRVQPNVGIRIEIVEQIFHKTSGWDPKSQKDTPTIGAGIGNIMAGDNRKCEFRVKTEADASPAAEKIENVFREFALPYYQKYGSLQAIDAELNSHPQERTPHRGYGWLRCSTGIIVARLVGRPNYEALAEIYTKVITEVDRGFYLKYFMPLLESLKTIDPGKNLWI
jgi:hypothetical protein